MTREENAKVLMTMVTVNCLRPDGRYIPDDQVEALKAGAAALRCLDEIENRLTRVLRDLPVWKDYYNNHPEELLRHVLDGPEGGGK